MSSCILYISDMKHMLSHWHYHAARKKPKKEAIDYVVRFFMVATPLFEIPQAIVIYSSKDASGVSLLTWGFFVLSSITWLSFGLKYRLMPLIVAHSLYILVELSVVVGIILYS